MTQGGSRAKKKVVAVKVVAITRAPEFHRAVVSALQALANARRAAEMSAYMRGQFAYLGIGTPERRATVRMLIHRFKPVDAHAVRSIAERLWGMQEREYRYVAVDFLLYHNAALSVRDLPWLLKLAQDEPWWDSVDSIVKVVGRIVRRERAKGQRAMDRALKAKSFWVRRIAMLHQLGWKGETDTTRLFAYADALAEEKEFFIRKAIGWALRDYAWHDPAAVRQYLEGARERLSPLTYREAGKHCPKCD